MSAMYRIGPPAPGDDPVRQVGSASHVPEHVNTMEIWSYVRDEGRPLGTGDQVPVPNHRELLS